MNVKYYRGMPLVLAVILVQLLLRLVLLLGRSTGSTGSAFFDGEILLLNYNIII
jgi:hypothetical protein